MKNKLSIILLIISFFGLDATISYTKRKNESSNEKKLETEIRGVYISYLEFYEYFYQRSSSINKSKIDKIIEQIKLENLNTIFLHVSPFSDSIYESKIFPYSSTLSGTEGKNPGFDYLDYFIKKAHLNNLKIHAWINPYRISFNNNTDSISDKNPAFKLLQTSSVKITKEGIYYNPASELVKELIIHQVEELIKNYEVDGIHFDDYFYMQKDIDVKEFNEYKKNNPKISLKEFRLMHTNDLIQRVYQKIKEINPKILFSIAPDGNINNNYLYHYADVKTWLSNDGYVDFIMPQIYYGFENEYLSFLKALESWISINKLNKKMIPVLALYKCGTIDKEAGKGKNEWINNSDILLKQITIMKNKGINSYTFFRYYFMDNSKKINEKCVKEMFNVKKIYN